MTLINVYYRYKTGSQDIGYRGKTGILSTGIYYDMVDQETFRQIALSFPGTIEQPHFERRAFKVINKIIFATLHEETNTANVRLSPGDQLAFCEYDSTAVYPVPNKWGLQGWTTFELIKIPEELIAEALHSAYEDVIKRERKRR